MLEEKDATWFLSGNGVDDLEVGPVRGLSRTACASSCRAGLASERYVACEFRRQGFPGGRGCLKYEAATTTERPDATVGDFLRANHGP